MISSSLQNSRIKSQQLSSIDIILLLIKPNCQYKYHINIKVWIAQKLTRLHNYGKYLKKT